MVSRPDSVDQLLIASLPARISCNPRLQDATVYAVAALACHNPPIRMATFELSVLAEVFVVCRLEATAPVPPWALADTRFVSITRTDDELTIICREDQAPDNPAVRWRCLKVHGPFPFSAIGVLSELTQALADARISLLAVSTHDTDYLFVQAKDLADSVRALRRRRHTVHVP
jgi:hypothetical protein